MNEEDIKRYISIITEEYKHYLGLAIVGLKDEIVAHRDNTKVHVQKAKRKKVL